jgi:hypothetical protein
MLCSATEIRERCFPTNQTVRSASFVEVLGRIRSVTVKQLSALKVLRRMPEYEALSPPLRFSFPSFEMLS